MGKAKRNTKATHRAMEKVLAKQGEQHEQMMTFQAQCQQDIQKGLQALMALQAKNNSQLQREIMQLKKDLGVVMKASSTGPSRIQPVPKKKVDSTPKPVSTRAQQVVTHRQLRSAAGRRVPNRTDGVEMFVTEDANGRFECPFCKKTFSPVQFRRHVKSKCVKADVTISVVRK